MRSPTHSSMHALTALRCMSMSTTDCGIALKSQHEQTSPRPSTGPQIPLPTLYSNNQEALNRGCIIWSCVCASHHVNSKKYIFIILFVKCHIVFEKNNALLYFFCCCCLLELLPFEINIFSALVQWINMHLFLMFGCGHSRARRNIASQRLHKSQA